MFNKYQVIFLLSQVNFFQLIIIIIIKKYCTFIHIITYLNGYNVLL